MDLAAFRGRYPEFVRVGDALVTAALADAAVSVSQDVFGNAYDTAHGLRAAHLVWTSVTGGTARLEGGEAERSQYEKDFWQIYLERVPRVTVV